MDTDAARNALPLSHTHTNTFSLCLFSLLRVLFLHQNRQMCSSSKHHSRVSSPARGRRGRQTINVPATEEWLFFLTRVYSVHLFIDCIDQTNCWQITNGLIYPCWDSTVDTALLSRHGFNDESLPNQFHRPPVKSLGKLVHNLPAIFSCRHSG